MSKLPPKGSKITLLDVQNAFDVIVGEDYASRVSEASKMFSELHMLTDDVPEGTVSVAAHDYAEERMDELVEAFGLHRLSP